MPPGGDYRTVEDCNNAQAACGRSHLALNCWIWGAVLTIAVMTAGSLTAFAVAQSARDSRQDTQIENLEKSQARVLDKLDLIEGLIRQIIKEGK